MPTRSRTELSRLVDTGSRTDPTVELTDKHWSLFEDLIPWVPPAPQGEAPKQNPEPVSMTLCGCCGQEPAGKIYQRSIRRNHPVMIV
ncbi:hypothetical protein GmarT_41490 [Gimesia maris]|uniref:Transposase n=1 Tax=Gimesia maris TaxID=122 RepID=A0ABX5YRR6_9PLAN|nr:hypothetical protein GmarT_41490 [Gimesia maris]